MNILPSQKNQLFDLITQSGLSNSEFHIDESVKNTFIVRCKNNDFYFSVEVAHSGFCTVSFCPGYNSIKDFLPLTPTSNVNAYFKSWLEYLKKEIHVEDKWARLQQEMVSSYVSFETESDKFSADEYKDLKVKMGVLKEQISLLPIEPTQLDVIQNKLDHLILQGETQSKFDWKSMFIGTMINVIIQLNVSPANAKALWDSIKLVFSGYFLN